MAKPNTENQWASAYAQMTDLPAWKDLEKYAKDQIEHSINSIDVKSAKDVTLGEYCEARGIRIGIAKILRYVEQRKEGI